MFDTILRNGNEHNKPAIIPGKSNNTKNIIPFLFIKSIPNIPLIYLNYYLNGVIKYKYTDQKF